MARLGSLKSDAEVPDLTASQIVAMDSESLSSNPLTILNAASRSEVQARLDAIEAKVNEIVAWLNPS